MRTLRSLGISKPAGLAHLTPEEISTQLLSESSRTVDSRTGDELLVVGTRIIWTSYGVLRQVYKIEGDGERITQALFVTFSLASSSPTGLTGESPDHPEHSEDSTTDGDQRTSRAVVALTKTQAHVYFIGGAAHIINLPFEAQKAFSTPFGLILQKAPAVKLVEISYKETKTPANSFATSQPGSQFSPESWKTQKPTQTSDPFFQELWKPYAITNTQKSRDESPRHLYIRDPLVEPGVVGEVSEKQTATRTLFLDFSLLPPDEDVIYVSSQSEVEDCDIFIAVTWNSRTTYHTIWKVVETPSRVSIKERSRVDAYLESKRRTSHGPGTGTTTPAVRASFGGYAEPRNTVKSRKQKPEAELASQLDEALEGHATVTQSSRRISSLLARSDLAAANDSAALTDPMPANTNRTTSFGRPSIRASFGPRSTRQSHYGAELQGTQADESSSDFTDTDSDHKSRHLNKQFRSLQHDVAFVKLHTYSMAPGLGIQNQGHNSKFEVVILQSHTISADGAQVLVVYTYNVSSRQVTCVSIGIVKRPGSSSSSGPGIQIRVRNTEFLSNIFGVSKLGDHASSSCFMLMARDDGSVALFKHIPWSSPIVVNLPSTFLIRNPFQISVARSVEKRREGGLKRVLSEGIDRLCGLRQTSQPHQLEVRDSKGTWHRLGYESGPRDPFVRRLLDTCKLLLTGQITEQATVNSLWDDICAWYTSTVSSSENIEWQSFVILLFSFFAPHLPITERARPVRTRRKAGLPRSSSGAQIDTEDFDAMMLTDEKSGGGRPYWFDDTSWQWITDSELPSLTTQDRMSPLFKKNNFIIEALQHARTFIATPIGQTRFGPKGNFFVNSPMQENHDVLIWLLAALHFVREEEKLNVLNAANVKVLAPILAQLGGWLGCADWDWRVSSYYRTDSTEVEQWIFDESSIDPLNATRPQISPPSIFEHVEGVLNGNTSRRFPSLADLPVFIGDHAGQKAVESLTPRSLIVLQILEMRHLSMERTVSELTHAGWNRELLETLPEGVVASIRSVLIKCQASPSTNLSRSAMSIIDREDLAVLQYHDDYGKPQAHSDATVPHNSTRDYHSITGGMLPQTDDVGAYNEAAEMDRRNITRLIFSTDQRFSEAIRMVHPLKPSTTRCVAEPDWTDQDLLEAQQELAKVIAFRTLSVSAGRAMLFYNARHPILTEKFPIHGFTLSTIMKPSNITVAADRTAYTEEKVSWAFFHAGVEAGLTISKEAKGIDTSWILFNKPKELSDRHAGFLLALGLNGHLRKIAKWVSFKYLTHKHQMTSIGFLLGLAASHIGTMDVPVARLLAVHATRMLPTGSANLNLSPLIQTTGIMALGLLYHNTQHRRMTEVMLSELESVEQEEGVSPVEDLRDEGYRLAAGFSLGYINLGCGREGKGLNDMKLVERLLSLVVATRKVSLVHILDKATAGATIAIALMFLKTGDQALAKKIDIPDTVHQFEYVRPDNFLLRTVARHLIMWDNIEASLGWVKRSLPVSLQKHVQLNHIRALHSEDLPLCNILAGLCLAIGLRFAGSAREDVRDLLVVYLDQFIRINKLPALHYDGKLTQITTRNCQDVVALAAAAVMAGTGDLILLRRYRSLHGRSNQDVPYGSHLAAHQAIGLLFLGGGTHSLGTSNLAVASLLCSFYPLFPSTVQDNKAHLQACRHFWVLAAEPRCLTVRSAETFKPMPMKVVVMLRSGKKLDLEAPCLLPEFNTISKIISNDRQYWEVVLDLETNPMHRTAFEKHQSIFARRRGPHNANKSVFSATMQTLNDRQAMQQARQQIFEWAFDLPSLHGLSQAERALLLPLGSIGLSSSAGRLTIVDDRLALEKECLTSTRAERLWNIRVLFAWTQSVRRAEDGLAWPGKEVVEFLRAQIALSWRD